MCSDVCFTKGESHKYHPDTLMCTHMPGFQSFFKFFVALFCIGQISYKQRKG